MGNRVVAHPWSIGKITTLQMGGGGVKLVMYGHIRISLFSNDMLTYFGYLDYHNPVFVP